MQALISRWFAVVRMHSRGRIWSLFSIAYQIPKLDVGTSAQRTEDPERPPPSAVRRSMTFGLGILGIQLAPAVPESSRSENPI